MNASRLLAAAVLAALALPAHAGIKVGTVAGTAITFEGLVQYDGNWYHDDFRDLDGDPDDSDSEDAFRRTELVLKGAGAGPLSWVIGYDVHARRWLDVNMAWKLDGGNTLVLGQAKVPFGLDELGSSKTMDFMSKAAAVVAFAPSRRVGAQWQHAQGPFYGAVGLFGREMAADTARGDGGAARFAWAPVVGEGRLLHLGIAFVDMEPFNDSLRLRARPQADLAAMRVIDTGALGVDHQQSWGLEGAWVHDRFKVQAEWLQSNLDRDSGGDFSADGGYVSAVWNLTGETWTYAKGVTALATPDNSGGLWQIGMRYDTLDFDDAGIAGGTMHTLTTGVNWYWRANTRFTLNYVAVRSDRAGIDDDPSIIEARVQLHW